MAKQREKVEFRYYEIGEDEPVLALLGEDWIREYGREIKYLHFHNLMEVGYCHWGTGEVILGQEHLCYSPGNILIVPPRLPHTTNSEKGTKSYWEWMYMDLEKIIAELNRYDPLFQKKMLKRIQKAGYLLAGEGNPGLSRLILGVMEEARQRKPYYKDCISGLLRACLAEFLRLSDDEERIMRKKTPRAVVSGALDYVADHYMHEIKISNLAEASSMSESHFRRVFEESMNMKPVDYINLIRIQCACELLKRTEKSMEEVAVASGFCSISSFNRNFKKVLTVSPYQWKRSAENYESKLLYCRISAQKGWE